ncbi:MAG TPA: hypothetical protein VJQ52_11325 [Steroidobacteraceae bacterium]|nr:hypothetical protein [Steroidobacteraceae bacterium]
MRNTRFRTSHVALAVATALSAATMSAAYATGLPGKAAKGQYVTGDFHNHTTCSDGSISMQKLVSKSTDKDDAPWGLDWFVQAGHGGNGNRNCTLAEDATLATPAYPLVKNQAGAILGPTTTWQNSIPTVQPKGTVSGSPPSQNMWRWQSVQEYQYPLLEYLSALKERPLFMGLESVVAGHEHTSMSVITGQMPNEIFKQRLPSGPGYSALGNATALSQWEYCFDRGDGDLSRGNTVAGGSEGNNWNCAVAGSLNEADPSWNAAAQKLVPLSGAGVGDRGHAKTVEAVRWMKQNHPDGSYYVPAHLERAGPFNPNGNNGFNVESLRDFNNAGPKISFGFESQPGHGASDARGEYTIRRNGINGVNVDSVGGTTYGGTGVYAGQVGGVWDALLGEGRNWWFFASSDWHNRGMFGPDDRRSTQDFYPGEYQRDFVMVRDRGGNNGHGPGQSRHGKDILTPQEIVDGLRSGNSFAASGQLIDRLAFVACADTKLNDWVGDLLLQAAAFAAAANNTDVDIGNCATMGEKLVVKPGQEVVVAIVARDPAGTNYSPYTFPNPSLAQVSMNQPLNKPVLDHIDVIRGLVSGYKTPGAPDYSGQWPNDWIRNPNMDTVPAGAKNTTAAVVRSFSKSNWQSVGDKQFKVMTYRIAHVDASQYLRLRGTNLPASVPFETDADGNPLPDLYTNSGRVNPTVNGGSDGQPENANLRIPCATVGSTDFDGCPAHLPVVNGQKMVAFDVAAWSDLWFYSNPIYIEVKGGQRVAGVN